MTGKIRGATHWSCNINLQLTKKVPLIFYNLRGYDSHLIFDGLNNFDVKIDVIPNSLEIGNDFKYLTKEFGSKNLELLKQKDAYPYEYMGSFKRFGKEKLPDRECFYSSLKDGTTGDNGEKLDGHISNKDYLTCKKNWIEFNMKNMGHYHNHYLKKDVLLLAVLEKFIDTCLKLYGLDPCHYFSSPGLSWDPMLKMTGVKLKK